GDPTQATFTLPVTGTYYVRVQYNYDYEGEYQLRIFTAGPSVQVEREPNNDTSHATPVTFVTSGGTSSATVTGAISSSSDLDYFSLGTVSAGQTILLSSRKPSYSGLDPVVSVYNATNGYVVESGNGRPFDGVAQVDITTSGVYYAVMRAGNVTG